MIAIGGRPVWYVCPDCGEAVEMGPDDRGLKLRTRCPVTGKSVVLSECSDGGGPAAGRTKVNAGQEGTEMLEGEGRGTPGEGEKKEVPGIGTPTDAGKPEGDFPGDPAAAAAAPPPAEPVKEPKTMTETAEAPPEAQPGGQPVGVTQPTTRNPVDAGAPQVGCEMEAYREQVLKEKARLDEMVERLQRFITSPAFNQVAGAEQDRLLKQREAMAAYAKILGARIDAGFK